MKYRCMIVDDEPLSHQVLENHMHTAGNLENIASAYNAEDARKLLEMHRVDILFLDIQMPEITGLEFLKSISSPPLTIFTTAYRRYALEGFDLGVVDYLLKPVSFERFQKAIKRAISLLSSREVDGKIEVKAGTQTLLLNLVEIDYARGMKDYTVLHVGNRKYVVKGSLKNYEKDLPSSHFIRVHKSYIVSRNKIKQMKQQKILFDGVEIPIGRIFRKVVEEYLRESATGPR